MSDDEIHNHPTVQRLLRGHSRHTWIIALLVIALVLVSAGWIHDYWFVPRSRL